MNLQKIKGIISSPLPEEQKRVLVLEEIANDKDAITDVLKMIEIQRNKDKQLILDMNVELSRSESHLSNEKLLKSKGQKEFVLTKIKDFYYKYKDRIGHCFHDYKFSETNYKPNE